MINLIGILSFAFAAQIVPTIVIRTESPHQALGMLKGEEQSVESAISKLAERSKTFDMEAADKLMHREGRVHLI